MKLNKKWNNIFKQESVNKLKPFLTKLNKMDIKKINKPIVNLKLTRVQKNNSFVKFKRWVNLLFLRTKNNKETILNMNSIAYCKKEGLCLYR